MKITASPRNISFIKKVLLVLPLTLMISAPSVFAEGLYDVGNFDQGQPTPIPGMATNSLGAGGNQRYHSYKTGESPLSAGLSGNTTNFTGKQLSGPSGHLALPYAGTGQLAPIFGMGGASAAGALFSVTVGNTTVSLASPFEEGTNVTPRFTSPADDPILLYSSPTSSVGYDPLSGGTFIRDGSASGFFGLGGSAADPLAIGANTAIQLVGDGDPGSINASVTLSDF